MLPVFTIIFFGVMYVKNASVLAQQNMSKARACAWKYSNDACEGELMDPECKPVLQQSNTPDTLFRTDIPPKKAGSNSQPQLDNKVGQYINNATDDDPPAGGLAGLLRGAVGDILKFVADIFENDKVDVSVARQLSTAKVLGNRRVTVAAGYRISCNVKAKTIKDVFLDFFDAVNPF